MVAASIRALHRGCGAAPHALAVTGARPSVGNLLLQPLGGAFTRVPVGATPLGQRDAPWAWQAGAAWFDSSLDADVARWKVAVRETLAPWARGESSPTSPRGPIPRGYAPATGPRSGSACRRSARWDPDGVFAAGHAITLPT
jgi:hypothetical protein